jgi:hypothetical protein
MARGKVAAHGLRAGARHATTGRVTRATGDSAASANGDGFASDWKELRADGEIQFAPLEMPKPPEPPAWWQDFLEWLGQVLEPLVGSLSGVARALGISGQVLLWIVVAIGGALILYLLWRILGLLALRRRKPAEAPAAWTPDPGEALALLDEADRLAAEGRYDEATHLLLRRSVGQIAAARPGWLEPSTTAREIAALPSLSQTARTAFGTIAEQVERSLFALRSLTRDDWNAARAAYADFALAAPQPGFA